MHYFECASCGYVYPPNNAGGTPPPFKDMPDDWKCPTCQGPKAVFHELGDEYTAARKAFEKQQEKI